MTTKTKAQTEPPPTIEEVIEADGLGQTDPQTQGETQAQARPSTSTFDVLATLPYTPSPFMDCCIQARVEVLPDEIHADDDGDEPLVSVIVRHTHSDECEIWRWVP